MIDGDNSYLWYLNNLECSNSIMCWNSGEWVSMLDGDIFNFEVLI